MANRITYTADDEDPMCSFCDHVDDDKYKCDECCGPECGWGGYQRTGGERNE